MKQTALASVVGLFVASIDRAEFVLKLVALLAPVVVGLIQCYRRPPRREPRKPRRVQSVLPLIVLFGALAVVGCGCVNTAALVKELRQDTNSVSVSVRSPWGTVDIKRN